MNTEQMKAYVEALEEEGKGYAARVARGEDAAKDRVEQVKSEIKRVKALIADAAKPKKKDDSANA